MPLHSQRGQNVRTSLTSHTESGLLASATAELLLQHTSPSHLPSIHKTSLTSFHEDVNVERRAQHLRSLKSVNSVKEICCNN